MPNFTQASVSTDTGLYDALNVQRDATLNMIKKQYRKLALQYHPDRNSGKEKQQAEIKFKQISEAYEILSDPEKRQVYDKYGLQAVRESSASGASKMPDIFESIPSFFGHRGRYENTHRRPKCVKVPLTLEAMMNGATTTVTITRKEIIDRANIETCSECGGRGKIIKMVQLGPGMMSQNIALCHQCEGLGKLVDFIDVEKVLTVTIPPGSSHGDTIPLRGMGDETVGSPEEQGDVIVLLEAEKHEHFSKRGDHLVYKRKICLSEALCGLELKLLHPNGKHIVLRYDEIIRPGVVKIVPDLGFPNKNNPLRRGHLLLEFSIQFPKKLSIKQKDLLAKLLPTRTKISAEELNTLSCYDIDTYCPSLHGELDAFASAEPRSSDTEERPQAPQCAQQ